MAGAPCILYGRMVNCNKRFFFCVGGEGVLAIPICEVDGSQKTRFPYEIIVAWDWVVVV